MRHRYYCFGNGFDVKVTIETAGTLARGPLTGPWRAAYGQRAGTAL